MASLSHRYFDLGSAESKAPQQISIPDDTLEEVQLASFETGYQAGWEDAAKAQASNADRAVIDMAQNLQDMSFSHHEAYLKLSSAMKPLFSQIVDKLLPKVARRLVGMHIVDQMTELMDSHAETAIQIAVAPDNLDDLQALLSDMVRVPFSLSAEPTLGSGQAYLRVGTAEREINLDAVLSGISEAIGAFYEQTKEEMTDGRP